jgi:hypothetical protein
MHRSMHVVMVSRQACSCALQPCSTRWHANNDSTEQGQVHGQDGKAEQRTSASRAAAAAACVLLRGRLKHQGLGGAGVDERQPAGDVQVGGLEQERARACRQGSGMQAGAGTCTRERPELSSWMERQVPECHSVAAPLLLHPHQQVLPLTAYCTGPARAVRSSFQQMAPHACRLTQPPA